MLGKLFIDVSETELTEDVGNEISISEDDYIRMLREYSANVTSDKDCSFTYENRYDDYSGDIKGSFSNASADVSVYNISDLPLTELELSEYCESDSMFALIIEFVGHVEDNFECEYKFWELNSQKISENEEYSEDEKIMFLPEKDMKLEVGDHEYLLSGCRHFKSYGKFDKFSILVNRINKIN